MAMALGVPLTAYDVVVKNFIPATLGNWLGGAVCVATVYAFAYGTPNKKVGAYIDRTKEAWRGRQEVKRGLGVGGVIGGRSVVPVA